MVFCGIHDKKQIKASTGECLITREAEAEHERIPACRNCDVRTSKLPKNDPGQRGRATVWAASWYYTYVQLLLSRVFWTVKRKLEPPPFCCPQSRIAT